MQRYITGHDGSASAGWHLLGSPVAIFTIDGSSFDPGSNDDLYRWSEVDGLWLNHKAGDPIPR
ncbi:MAG: hypothetical protein HN704_10800 [Bacteroidetes bacterium]|nr:hypothetical protein [Bacteroidota bacterium]MBT6835293.1 hypothetical protein [Bacteroidota bacterium]MBT7145006.1 hypothetical protein [Bacteroidota bacterium]MBT7492080.1 hypothetical protein [Bacteroidota bacterium]